MGRIVSLRAPEIQRADDWGKACERAVQGPNRTGLGVQDRYTIGYLGELAFLRLYEICGLRCTYSVETNGRSAATEFIVFVDGQPRRVDIKTAGQKTHRRFLMPTTAAPIERETWYVGARLLVHGRWLEYRDEIEVECHGWLPGTAVAALPIATFGDYDVQTHHCLLEGMQPLPSLLSQCDRGPIELRGRAADWLTR